MSINPKPELNISALRAKTQSAYETYRRPAVVPAPVPESGGPLPAPAHADAMLPAPPALDAWPFVDAVVRRWPVILLTGLLLGATPSMV